MKILVTGATGFLGSHIAEQLARDGHAVRVLVRRTSDRSFLPGLEIDEAW
ncbi:MAG: NAD-dependent epimerase/dehydratase family protein, partial [Chloroflexi bacterium]|nr:NAD-dependent epimerase/dehydratase family protein [Chloroflexota bacterium]